jgi:hypothetical protein
MSAALKTLSTALLILSLGSCGLWAVNENAGSSGFAPLKIVYSARAMAMGQALTGEAKNPDGLHFNPAAILNLPDKQVNTTYSNYFLDAQGGQVSLLLPKNKFTAWGLYLKYMNMGSMDRTEVDQNGDLIVTGDTFGAQNLTLGVSLAKWLSDSISAGMTLKFINDSLDDTSASALLLDFGIIHHPANSKVKVGISMRNIGRQITYYSDSEYQEGLPFTFAAGITYRFSEKVYTVMEVAKANGEDITAKLGGEYSISPGFALRAGFRSNAGDYYNGGSWAWTSGLSLGAGWSWKNYRLDYGLASYGDLGMVNQLTLGYNF